MGGYLVIQFCDGYRTILVFCFYLSQLQKLYFSRNLAISLTFSSLLAQRCSALSGFCYWAYCHSQYCLLVPYLCFLFKHTKSFSIFQPLDRSFGFVSRPLPRPLLVLFTSRIELEFLGLKWCEKSTNCKSSTKALLCLLLSSHAQKVCHSRCRTIMMCLSWLWRTQIEGFPAIKMAMSLLFDCG